MISQNINKLRKSFIDLKLDGYAIPKNDQYFSEFTSEDRLKFVSNFDGSAGLALIFKKKKYVICRWSLHITGVKTIR